jgi:uroporphyrinogen-III synthase
MAGHELAGVRVLVTRPAGQADALQQMLAARGASATALPLLTITPLASPPAAALQGVDIVIFVSTNAVQHASALLPQLPASAQVGAIGQATAAALQAAGIRVDLLPARFDSEAFLALPALQSLRDKRVVIVRGAGGREKLAAELRQRGAQVEYLEVYRRDCPNWSSSDVQCVLAADIITITSAEALQNLAQLAREHQAPALFARPLAVLHERIASRAMQLGFTLKPFVAKQASDAALVEAVLDWRQQQGV